MSHTIFYSWQSDLPNDINHNFIERAAREAAKSIREDESVEFEPVVDRDTIGIAGSPDIGATIFDKIRHADLFLCDVTIIGSISAKRSTPNPNVLIELGYAWSAMGENRVLLVMNTALGNPEMLPFDLRRKKVIKYHLPDEATESDEEFSRLQKELEEAFHLILNKAGLQAPETARLELTDQAVASIESQSPDRRAILRRFWSLLLDDFVNLAPDISGTHAVAKRAVSGDNWTDPRYHYYVEEFLYSINTSVPLVDAFTRVAEAVALSGDNESAMVLLKGFEELAMRYRLPNRYSGGFNNEDFDFFKFIGHQLFVSFIALLLREDRWVIIEQLLTKNLYVENAHGKGSMFVGFGYLSQEVILFRNIKNPFGPGVARAEKLRQLHTKTELTSTVAFNAFADADLFLYLHKNEAPNASFPMYWEPYSLYYLGDRTPRYLLMATEEHQANQLARSLGLSGKGVGFLSDSGIEEFREHVAKRLKSAQRFYNGPMSSGFIIGFDVQTLGSQ